MFGNRRNRQGSRPQQARQAPRNEITFADALKTLKSMFADMDESVLKLVLESNQGRMETTVEHLLAMSGQAESPPQAAGPAAAGQNAAPAAYQPPAEAQPKNLSNAPEKPMVTGQHNLAEDFLRPPSYFKGAAASQQEEEDLMLAKILQDSLFMADLQQHPEWVLGNDANAKRGGRRPKPRPAGRNWNVGNAGSINAGPQAEMSQAEYTRQLNRQNTDSRMANFKSKFAGLGASARAKVAALAAKMKGQNNQRGPTGPSEYHALNSLDDNLDSPPANNNRNQKSGNKSGFAPID